MQLTAKYSRAECRCCENGKLGLITYMGYFGVYFTPTFQVRS